MLDTTPGPIVLCLDNSLFILKVYVGYPPAKLFGFRITGPCSSKHFYRHLNIYIYYIYIYNI